jgi:hypothetical protein
MDFSIAFVNSVCQRTGRNKKGHGSLEAAHGLFYFQLNAYNGTGQTSSMFSQHHQFP